MVGVVRVGLCGRCSESGSVCGWCSESGSVCGWCSESGSVCGWCSESGSVCVVGVVRVGVCVVGVVRVGLCVVGVVRVGVCVVGVVRVGVCVVGVARVGVCVVGVVRVGLCVVGVVRVGLCRACVLCSIVLHVPLVLYCDVKRKLNVHYQICSKREWSSECFIIPVLQYFNFNVMFPIYKLPFRGKSLVGVENIMPYAVYPYTPWPALCARPTSGLQCPVRIKLTSLSALSILPPFPPTQRICLALPLLWRLRRRRLHW